MAGNIHVQALDVEHRLAQLGLEEQPIADVVRRGYIKFISCTANDPPLYPGFAAWAEMVRALREYLLPKQWYRSDENNYSLVVNLEGTVAIAVATGDEATGRRDAEPTTKSTRGTCTVAAVAVNNAQLSLFDFPPSVPPTDSSNDEENKRMTWVLLVHRAKDEIRCELSLPKAMGDDSRIHSWEERIILGSILTDSDLLEIVPPSLPPSPDINIDIKRRA